MCKNTLKTTHDRESFEEEETKQKQPKDSEPAATVLGQGTAQGHKNSGIFQAWQPSVSNSMMCEHVYTRQEISQGTRPHHDSRISPAQRRAFSEFKWQLESCCRSFNETVVLIQTLEALRYLWEAEAQPAVPTTNPHAIDAGGVWTRDQIQSGSHVHGSVTLQNGPWGLSEPRCC